MSLDDPQAAPSAIHESCGPDPALEALIQLLESERNQASATDRISLQRSIPARSGCCGLRSARRSRSAWYWAEADRERNDLFRHIAHRIFPAGVRSACDPIRADRRLIDLFESAGAAAVQACIRGDERLGYYLAGLRVSADRGTPPLLN